MEFPCRLELNLVFYIKVYANVAAVGLQEDREPYDTTPWSVRKSARLNKILCMIYGIASLRTQPSPYRRGDHVQELRDKQAMAEKAALEAKRARVLEDMKRRQQRLQRLQEEEG